MHGIGLMAMGTPQSQLESLFAGLRSTRPEATLLLSLDSLEGTTSLDSLTAGLDALFFSRIPLGFGAARQRLLAGSEVLGLTTAVIGDGDGQFSANSLVALHDAGCHARGPRLLLGQRMHRSLPGLEEMAIRRETLERFENWTLARVAGRPDLASWDLQPGAFCVVGEEALRLLRDVRDVGFAWDLAMVQRCLEAAIPIDPIAVEARAQTKTSFTEADAADKLRWLRERFGSLREPLRSFLDAGRVDDGEARALADAVVRV